MINNTKDILGSKTIDDCPKIRHIASIAAISVPMIVLATYLIKGDHNLPQFISNIFFIILVIIVLVLIGYSFFPYINQAWRGLIKKKHLRALAKNHFNTLINFEEQLEKFTSLNNSNSILHVLRDIKTLNQNFYGFENYFRRTLQDFRFGHNMLGCNGPNFILLLKWLDSMIVFYHNEVICYSIDSIRNSNSQVEDSAKEDFKICREAYIKFIYEYVDFSNSINKTYEEHVACDYFAPVKYL